MSQGKPHVPRVDFTPASTTEDHLFGENNHFDFNQGLYYKAKSGFLRAIRPFNPFAPYSTSTNEHVGRQVLSRRWTKERSLLVQT